MPRGKSSSRLSRRKPSSPGGQPAFEPTPEQRQRVLAIMRLEDDPGGPKTQQEISDYLGIDPKTFRKVFRNEIQTAKPEVKASLQTSMLAMALGRPAEYAVVGGQTVKVRDELPPNARAAIFLLKTKFGFKETVRHELQGGGAGSPPIVVQQDSFESKF